MTAQSQRSKREEGRAAGAPLFDDRARSVKKAWETPRVRRVAIVEETGGIYSHVPYDGSFSLS